MKVNISITQPTANVAGIELYGVHYRVYDYTTGNKDNQYIVEELVKQENMFSYDIFYSTYEEYLDSKTVLQYRYLYIKTLDKPSLQEKLQNKEHILDIIIENTYPSLWSELFNIGSVIKEKNINLTNFIATPLVTVNIDNIGKTVSITDSLLDSVKGSNTYTKTEYTVVDSYNNPVYTSSTTNSTLDKSNRLELYSKLEDNKMYIVKAKQEATTSNNDTIHSEYGAKVVLVDKDNISYLADHSNKTPENTIKSLDIASTSYLDFDMIPYLVEGTEFYINVKNINGKYYNFKIVDAVNSSGTLYNQYNQQTTDNSAVYHFTVKNDSKNSTKFLFYFQQKDSNTDTYTEWTMFKELTYIDTPNIPTTFSNMFTMSSIFGKLQICRMFLAKELEFATNITIKSKPIGKHNDNAILEHCSKIVVDNRKLEFFIDINNNYPYIGEDNNVYVDLYYTIANIQVILLNNLQIQGVYNCQMTPDIGGAVLGIRNDMKKVYGLSNLTENLRVQNPMVFCTLDPLTCIKKVKEEHDDLLDYDKLLQVTSLEPSISTYNSNLISFYFLKGSLGLTSSTDTNRHLSLDDLHNLINTNIDTYYSSAVLDKQELYLVTVPKNTDPKQYTGTDKYIQPYYSYTSVQDDDSNFLISQLNWYKNNVNQYVVQLDTELLDSEKEYTTWLCTDYLYRDYWNNTANTTPFNPYPLYTFRPQHIIKVEAIEDYDNRSYLALFKLTKQTHDLRFTNIIKYTVRVYFTDRNSKQVVDYVDLVYSKDGYYPITESMVRHLSLKPNINYEVSATRLFNIVGYSKPIELPYKQHFPNISLYTTSILYMPTFVQDLTFSSNKILYKTNQNPSYTIKLDTSKVSSFTVDINIDTDNGILRPMEVRTISTDSSLEQNKINYVLDQVDNGNYRTYTVQIPTNPATDINNGLVPTVNVIQPYNVKLSVHTKDNYDVVDSKYTTILVQNMDKVNVITAHSSFSLHYVNTPVHLLLNVKDIQEEDYKDTNKLQQIKEFITKNPNGMDIDTESKDFLTATLKSLYNIENLPISLYNKNSKTTSRYEWLKTQMTWNTPENPVNMQYWSGGYNAYNTAGVIEEPLRDKINWKKMNLLYYSFPEIRYYILKMKYTNLFNNNQPNQGYANYGYVNFNIVDENDPCSFVYHFKMMWQILNAFEILGPYEKAGNITLNMDKIPQWPNGNRVLVEKLVYANGPEWFMQSYFMQKDNPSRWCFCYSNYAQYNPSNYPTPTDDQIKAMDDNLEKMLNGTGVSIPNWNLVVKQGTKYTDTIDGHAFFKSMYCNYAVEVYGGYPVLGNTDSIWNRGYNYLNDNHRRNAGLFNDDFDKNYHYGIDVRRNMLETNNTLHPVNMHVFQYVYGYMNNRPCHDNTNSPNGFSIWGFTYNPSVGEKGRFSFNVDHSTFDNNDEYIYRNNFDLHIDGRNTYCKALFPRGQGDWVGAGMYSFPGLMNNNTTSAIFKKVYHKVYDSERIRQMEDLDKDANRHDWLYNLYFVRYCPMEYYKDAFYKSNSYCNNFGLDPNDHWNAGWIGNIVDLTPRNYTDSYWVDKFVNSGWIRDKGVTLFDIKNICMFWIYIHYFVCEDTPAEYNPYVNPVYNQLPSGLQKILDECTSHYGWTDFHPFFQNIPYQPILYPNPDWRNGWRKYNNCLDNNFWGIYNNAKAEGVIFSVPGELLGLYDIEDTYTKTNFNLKYSLYKTILQNITVRIEHDSKFRKLPIQYINTDNVVDSLEVLLVLPEELNKHRLTFKFAVKTDTNDTLVEVGDVVDNTHTGEYHVILRDNNNNLVYTDKDTELKLYLVFKTIDNIETNDLSSLIDHIEIANTKADYNTGLPSNTISQDDKLIDVKSVAIAIDNRKDVGDSSLTLEPSIEEVSNVVATTLGSSNNNLYIETTKNDGTRDLLLYNNSMVDNGVIFNNTEYSKQRYKITMGDIEYKVTYPNVNNYYMVHGNDTSKSSILQTVEVRTPLANQFIDCIKNTSSTDNTDKLDKALLEVLFNKYYPNVFQFYYDNSGVHVLRTLDEEYNRLYSKQYYRGILPSDTKIGNILSWNYTYSYCNLTNPSIVSDTDKVVFGFYNCTNFIGTTRDITNTSNIIVKKVDDTDYKLTYYVYSKDSKLDTNLVTAIRNLNIQDNVANKLAELLGKDKTLQPISIVNVEKVLPVTISYSNQPLPKQYIDTDKKVTSIFVDLTIPEDLKKLNINYKFKLVTNTKLNGITENIANYRINSLTKAEISLLDKDNNLIYTKDDTYLDIYLEVYDTDNLTYDKYALVEYLRSTRLKRIEILDTTLDTTDRYYKDTLINNKILDVNSVTYIEKDDSVTDLTSKTDDELKDLTQYKNIYYSSSTSKEQFTIKLDENGDIITDTEDTQK